MTPKLIVIAAVAAGLFIVVTFAVWASLNLRIEFRLTDHRGVQTPAPDGGLARTNALDVTHLRLIAATSSA